MIRLWLIIGLVGLGVWYVYKRVSGNSKQKDSVEEAEVVKDLESEKGSYRPLGFLLALIGIAIVVFLILPKFGLHPLALIQKFMPMLGALRNLLL